MPSSSSVPVRSVQRLPISGGQRFARGRTDSQIEFCFVGKAGVDEQGGVKRRHAIEDGRLLLDQALEHRIRRRPLGHQNGGGADGEREGQRVAQAVGEEQLRRGEHHVGLADAEHRHGVELGGEDEVRVQVHRALRRAGRARRVEPEAHVVAQRWGGLGLRRSQLRAVRWSWESGNDLVKTEAVEVLQQRLGHEYRFRAAVLELVLVVRRREERVQRDRHDAGLDCAEE